MNRRLSALLALVSLVGFSAFANTYYAKPNGADDATCADEANAGSISNAVAKALADANNTVVLLDGEYDCSGICNPTKTDYAFYLNQAITLKSKSDDPNKVLLVGSGTMDKKKACIYTGSSVKLQALTITNFYSSANGSAIYVGASTLTMTKCTVACCRSTTVGGAIYQNYNLKANLYNCHIRKCSSSSSSAVCYSHGGTTTAYDCEISDCYVDATNGGSTVFDGTWNRCTFSGCYTTGTGGNAYGAAGSSAKLNNCVISNCWCNGADRAICKGCAVKDSVFTAVPKNGIGYNTTFERCTFRENKTYLNAANSSFLDCLVVSNSYTAGGLAYPLMGGTIKNCTIVGNYAPRGSSWNRGCLFPASATIYNCIVAENQPGTALAAITWSPSYIKFVNCIIPKTDLTGQYGEGIQLVDTKMLDNLSPEFDQVKFVGANDQGLPYYSLLRKSPAVDKGDNLAYTVDSLDLAGNPRVVTKGQTLAKDPNAIVDLGCYENQDRAPGMLLLVR